MVRRVALVGVVCSGLLLAACGESNSRLENADAALGKLERGEIAVSVRASAGEAGSVSSAPVGFDVSGRFDIRTGSTLPVLDMTFARLLGDQKQEMTVQSDGNRMVVTTDGVPVEVPPEQARRLHLASGDRPAGIDELGVSGWITEPTETEGPAVDGVATRRISGPVDGADLVSDLAALANQLSGQGDTNPLEGASAARVQSRVRSGEVEVLVDDNDLPRRARATVDFGAAVAPELQKALGPYAGASLEVTLEIRAPGQPVTAPKLP